VTELSMLHPVFPDFGAHNSAEHFAEWPSLATIFRQGQWPGWSQSRDLDARECRVVAMPAERLDYR
jgi:hypothetical protein